MTWNTVPNVLTKVFTLLKIAFFALEHIETIEEENWGDRRRVFVNMKNGDIYELSMRKLTEEQVKECGNFYGGK